MADSDADLARLVGLHRDQPDLVIGLIAGDLCRTLGGRGDVAERRGGQTTVVPVDVAVASFAGEQHLFMAHLLARRRLHPGSGAIVMNADRIGPFLLAPKGHPGDGILDITRGSMPLRQLLLARSLARTGDHLPHPALTTTRADAVDLAFDRTVVVRLDGVNRGTSRQITVRLEDHQVLVAV